MDTIGEIISTFTDDDVAAFKNFVNRQKKLKNRKDLDLFSVLQKKPESKPRDIIAILYPDNNTEAYQALRKKLLRQIMNYLVLKQFDDEVHSISAVMGMLGLARYLFDRAKDKLAWNYLLKAEAMATAADQFEQLRLILLTQIEYSASNFAPQLSDILAKYEQNKQLAEQAERAEIALGIIKHNLKQARLLGFVSNFDELVSNVMLRYDLQRAMLTQARLLYQVVSIIRTANIVRKEYLSFEPFLLDYYSRFETQTGFQPKDVEYKAGLLYIISHTLYRNKKFADSLLYLDSLQALLRTTTVAIQMQYLDKQLMLHAANLFFTNKIEQAISLLIEARHKTKFLTPAAELNLCLNTSIYQIYAVQASKACKTLLSIEQSNAWCIKNMGEEWVLKRNLCDAIVQYELENFDVALNCLKAIERNHKLFMQQEQYRRVNVFIGLIKEIILHPEYVSNMAFAAKLEASFDWLPVEQEDLQAVLFYAWFKSKVIAKPAYETLRKVLLIE